MSWESLTRVYLQKAAGRGVSKLPRQRVSFLGESTVTFEGGGMDKETYNIEDAYAKILKKQIKADTSEELDSSIDEIFKLADWTGNQKAAKDALKNITIKTSYPSSVELLDYVGSNKQNLYSLSDLEIGSVFDFLEGIKNKLPENFNQDGVDEFIRDIHMYVIPKASTGVGLGEGTFTILGTAQKGKSGDLQWDGLEVEVKTNGKDNSGAILGGDGYLNKITDRLESVLDYENLKVGEFKKYNNQIKEIEEVYPNDIEKAKTLFKNFISKSSNLLNLFKNQKLERLLNTINVDQFFNLELNKDFTPRARQTGSGLNTPIKMLAAKIESAVNRAANLGTNLPGQISTFITDDLTAEDYIRIYSEFKTYSDTKGIDKQLAEFFASNDYREFNPRSNYTNFQRLVGAIALVSYQQKIGFDLITTGNDKKMTMAVIDCRNANVLKVYNQLVDLPEVVFDLNIDVYEGGSFKSQTVIAKSPRIILK